MAGSESDRELSADSQVVGDDAPVPFATSSRRINYPIIMDLILTLGLLLVSGGFTVGLFQMYLLHAAEKTINEHNYKAALSILRDSPIPEFLRFGAADTTELLNQALYLDAMDKIDSHTDMVAAIHQLRQIKPSSRYYRFAQETLSDIIMDDGDGQVSKDGKLGAEPRRFDPFAELKPADEPNPSAAPKPDEKQAEH